MHYQQNHFGAYCRLPPPLPWFQRGETDPPGTMMQSARCVLCSDERLILIASRDHLLKLWDARSGSGLVPLHTTNTESDPPLFRRAVNGFSSARCSAQPTGTPIRELLQSLRVYPTLIPDFIFINEYLLLIKWHELPDPPTGPGIP